MNRDMDVIRKILIASTESNVPVKSVEGVPDNVFAFNAALLEEAGLARCLVHIDSDRGTELPDFAIVWRLTWQGFEFAQSIADDTIWNKAKEHIIKPTVSWSFGLLLEYLRQEAATKLGISNGS